MARYSKLTDSQWEDIEKRLLSGEKPASLAKEYGINRSAITRKFSQQLRNVKDVANQLVSAEVALRALPVAQQLTALSLADDLRAISTHLAGAAKHGAMTAHRLSGIANFKAQEIDDAAPLGDESMEALKGIAALSKVANLSAEIGLNLLRANKETVDGLNRDADRPEPKQIVFTVADASA